MIGVISDTHGLVRPQVAELFKGAEMIIHAGDIGSSKVLDSLEAIAPVKAVRGNNDRDPWAQTIPLTHVIEHDSHCFYVLHELESLDLDLTAPEFSGVIFGHSHRPCAEIRKGMLYLNPGSAGPRRFRLPLTVARLHFNKTGLTPEIIELKP